jgi:hypothetical protein
MAKKAEETTEEIENVFEGFNFLNEPTPKSASKKEPAKKSVEQTSDNSDDLSEEDIAALNQASEELKTKGKKAVSKEVEETEEEEEEIEEPEVKSNEFDGFAKFLSEEGVLDLEETDKFESEKDLAKVVDRTIKSGIEKYKESIPEDGKKFLEFVEAGGKPADFHKYYYGEATFEDFDITSEENKKYVITEALKLEEYSDEEIAEELALYEDTDKLDKKAEMFLKKLQKVEKQNQNLLLETQKAYAKEQEEKNKQVWDEFKKGLFDKDTIGGFKMTPKMKEDTWSYMTKIVDKKQGLTQMQIDDRENKDARYIYAYLLKNKWDMKSLEKQVETKQVSKLRDKLSNYTDTRSKLKSPKSNIERDDENLDNPFEGFKKVFK